MSYLYPTALADAARSASALRGWGQAVGGIGFIALVAAAFTGWNPAVVAIISGFMMGFFAERNIHSAVAGAAADVASPFDVSFDQSWIPVIHGLYRQAQADVNACRQA